MVSAAELLHPFLAFLQGAWCSTEQTLPQYPVSGLAILLQLGLLQGRFKIPAGDGDLAPAPREAVPGVVSGAGKRALAGLWALLDAGEGSSLVAPRNLM